VEGPKRFGCGGANLFWCYEQIYLVRYIDIYTGVWYDTGMKFSGLGVKLCTPNVYRKWKRLGLPEIF